MKHYQIDCQIDIIVRKDHDVLKKHVGGMIEEFHAAKLRRLNTLTLKDIVTSKNILLYRANNLLTVSDLVAAMVEAKLSSSEETIFGNLLEATAIVVAEARFGGVKSSSAGLDLELERDGCIHLVSIKSGPNAMNSSSMKAYEKYCKDALSRKAQVRQRKPVKCVLGFCYGNKRKSDRGLYTKLYGKDFWNLVSGEDGFHQYLMSLIAESAFKHQKSFDAQKSSIINKLTFEFMDRYCEEGNIQWSRLLRKNSGGFVTSC